MNLPFTQEQFFAVFAAYNLAVWPAQWVLAALAAALTALAWQAPAWGGRAIAWGLTLLWVWLALAYHLAFFVAINPAAPAFATLSLAAAGAFAWCGGIRGTLRFTRHRSPRTVAGLAVVVVALAVYPALGAWLGHRYPMVPTFGLPCPTTIFTFGLLLMAAPPLPRAVLVAPLLWAAIGSTAAFALGVVQDFALLAAAACGVWMLWREPPVTAED